MGQKSNPIGLRLQINRTWDSRWYAGDDYARLLHDDLKLRAHLRKKLHGAGVSRVVIERPAKKPRVTIYAARPGVVIGKRGQDIEVLKKDLSKMASAEVALLLDNLGIAHEELGEFEQATRLYERALAIRERAFPADDPELAASHRNLAEVQLLTGEFDQAKLSFERTLAILEKVHGADALELAKPTQRLGETLAKLGVEVVQSDRGGDVTYHGPGQVVAYPLIDLQRAGYFVKEYVYRIEEAVIRTLDHFGVTGHRVAGAPGIYVRLDDPHSHARLPQAPARREPGSPAPDPVFTGLGKIAALADDLALALSAPAIRIQAPVPGKGYVGIEVPNEEIALVALRDVIEGEAFRRLKSPLRFALGQDVAGNAVAADLAGMPHLLVAGATGSGKSVCVNALITCLLLHNTPDDLRLQSFNAGRTDLRELFAMIRQVAQATGLPGSGDVVHQRSPSATSAAASFAAA